MTLFVSRLQTQGLSGSGSGLKQICGLACPEPSALCFSPIHETDLEIIEKRRVSFLCGGLTGWLGGCELARWLRGWLGGLYYIRNFRPKYLASETTL